jgi:hypothetical protein
MLVSPKAINQDLSSPIGRKGTDPKAIGPTTGIMVNLSLKAQTLMQVQHQVLLLSKFSILLKIKAIRPSYWMALSLFKFLYVGG